VQHTNTSSMSCGSTTGLLCRELGARGSARQTSKMDKVEIGRPLFSQTGRLLTPNLGRQTGRHTHTQTHGHAKKWVRRPKPIGSRARYFHAGGYGAFLPRRLAKLCAFSFFSTRDDLFERFCHALAFTLRSRVKMLPRPSNPFAPPRFLGVAAGPHHGLRGEATGDLR
jgi:hypothetical protein